MSIHTPSSTDDSYFLDLEGTHVPQIYKRINTSEYWETYQTQLKQVRSALAETFGITDFSIFDIDNFAQGTAEGSHIGFTFKPLITRRNPDTPDDHRTYNPSTETSWKVKHHFIAEKDRNGKALSIPVWDIDGEVIDLMFQTNPEISEKIFKCFGVLGSIANHDGTSHAGLFFQEKRPEAKKVIQKSVLYVKSFVSSQDGSEPLHYEMFSAMLHKLGFEAACNQNPKLRKEVIKLFRYIVISIERLARNVQPEFQQPLIDYWIYIAKFNFGSLIPIDCKEISDLRKKHPAMSRNNRFINGVHTKSFETLDGETISAEAYLKQYVTEYEESLHLPLTISSKEDLFL